MTFVSVGNAKHQFHRLLKGVAVIASKLPQPVVVQHGYTPFESPLCKAKAFMGMGNLQQYQDANSLCACQAGSIIHAISRKVPVVMPRRVSFGEHINDHQVQLQHCQKRVKWL